MPVLPSSDATLMMAPERRRGSDGSASTPPRDRRAARDIRPLTLALRPPSRPSQQLRERLRGRRQAPPAQPHHVPLAIEREALDVEEGEPLRGELEVERRARQDRDAEAGDGRLLDGAVAGEHELLARGEAARVEESLLGEPRPGALLAQEPGLLPQGV